MTKAEKFKEYIKGRNVTGIGIGISNMPVIRISQVPALSLRPVMHMMRSG